MKNISKLIAAALVLSGAVHALAAGNSPFDGGALSLKDYQVQAPEASGPAPAMEEKVNAMVPARGYSASELAAMRAHNAALGQSFNKGLSYEEERVERKYRPYADYEAAGYLIMSADLNFNSRQAKLELAKALPADGTLVIFTDYDDAGTKENILRTFETVVPRARIKVIKLQGTYRGFWARDGVPVPAINKDGGLVVVDAKYGHGFEPDAEIARLFGAGLERHEYYYEGGNFMANAAGDCIMVNHGFHTQIPDSVFIGQYGCRQMIRLPFVDGIGHIDEHVRFVAEKTVLTDLPEYKDVLAGKGFDVRMLPKPTGPYETYVNSVIMNGKAVVPVFGRDSDRQALAVYESVGFKAAGADSRGLSNQGQGSVHCITMTYPKVPAAALMKALNAREL
jgi:agmatine/peptidylarginine deiminase